MGNDRCLTGNWITCRRKPAGANGCTGSRRPSLRPASRCRAVSSRAWSVQAATLTSSSTTSAKNCAAGLCRRHGPAPPATGPCDGRRSTIPSPSCRAAALRRTRSPRPDASTVARPPTHPRRGRRCCNCSCPGRCRGSLCSWSVPSFCQHGILHRYRREGGPSIKGGNATGPNRTDSGKPDILRKYVAGFGNFAPTRLAFADIGRRNAPVLLHLRSHMAMA